MIIDAHTHLDEYIKYDNGSELERRALEEIISNKIISLSCSMDIPSYHKNLKLAKECSFIIPCFGIHPWKAENYEQKSHILNEYIHGCKIIGEIGLDFLWADKHTFKSQVRVFQFFLEENRRDPKIMNIHTKGAEKDVINLLKKYKAKRVIIHWYSGELSELRELINMGCYFTLGVELYNSEKIRSIAREIPSNRLLIETDNPGGKEWLTDKTGMPVDIKQVYQEAAKIKNMALNEFELLVQDNFFNI